MPSATLLTTVIKFLCFGLVGLAAIAANEEAQDGADAQRFARNRISNAIEGVGNLRDRKIHDLYALSEIARSCKSVQWYHRSIVCRHTYESQQEVLATLGKELMKSIRDAGAKVSDAPSLRGKRNDVLHEDHFEYVRGDYHGTVDMISTAVTKSAGTISLVWHEHRKSEQDEEPDAGKAPK